MSLGRGVCWEQITGGNCEYNNAKNTNRARWTEAGKGEEREKKSENK